MKESLRLEILERLEGQPGRIGFYYRNLVSGEEIRYQDDMEMMAASVIKLYIMAAAFDLMGRGELDGEQTIAVRKDCLLYTSRCV